VAFVPGPKASRASGGDRGLLSRLEIPTWTKGRPFVPVGGSTRDKRPNPFIPVGNTNPDKRVTLLSRLVAPTRTKGPFYQPGQKAPPRDSSKGSYSLLSHMYYLGERLLSRQPNPGSKTGTNSPLEPGQMARSVVVSGGWLVHLSRCDLVLQYSHPASNYMFRCCACLLLTKHIYAE